MVLLCLASGVYLCQPSKDGGELQARILETVCSCSLSGTWQARRRTVSGREEAVQRANEAQQEMLKAGASKQWIVGRNNATPMQFRSNSMPVLQAVSCHCQDRRELNGKAPGNQEMCFKLWFSLVAGFCQTLEITWLYILHLYLCSKARRGQDRPLLDLFPRCRALVLSTGTKNVRGWLLTQLTATLQLASWLEFHASTCFLTWVSRFNLLTDLSVTLQLAYWLECHASTCLLTWVSRFNLPTNGLECHASACWVGAHKIAMFMLSWWSWGIYIAKFCFSTVWLFCLGTLWKLTKSATGRPGP